MKKLILPLILLGIGIVNCNSLNYSSSCIHKKGKATESVDSVYSDSIPNVYMSVINEYSPERKGVGHSEYFLYDITGDNFPELWISHGNCEADTKLTVYTNENGKIRQILSGEGGHSDYFVFNGKLVSVMCNTGAGTVIIYKYNKGKISEQAIEFSTWNDDGKALSDDIQTNKILDYWENNYDKYISLIPID